MDGQLTTLKQEVAYMMMGGMGREQIDAEMRRSYGMSFDEIRQRYPANTPVNQLPRVPRQGDIDLSPITPQMQKVGGGTMEAPPVKWDPRNIPGALMGMAGGAGKAVAQGVLSTAASLMPPPVVTNPWMNPLVGERIGPPTAIEQQRADVRHVMKERQKDPRLLNVMREGVDVLVGSMMVPYEVVAAATGFRTPKEGERFGEQLVGGMVGAPYEMAKQYATNTGQAFQAYPLTPFMAVAPAMRSLVKMPLPQVARSGLRRFDQSVMRAAQNVGPASTAVQKVAGSVAKRVPQSIKWESAPTVGGAFGGMGDKAMSGLMWGLWTGDLVSPLLGAAAGTLGVPATKAAVSAAFRRLKPGAQAQMTRWLSDWTAQGTEAETDIARAATVEAQRTKQAIQGVGREIAGRVNEGAELKRPVPGDDMSIETVVSEKQSDIDKSGRVVAGDAINDVEALESLRQDTANELKIARQLYNNSTKRKGFNPNSAATKRAKAQISALKSRLDDLSTPGKIERDAGFIRDVAKGKRPVWTTDAVLNSGMARLHELVNKGAVNKQGFKRAEVARWFTEPLMGDGIALLHDAGIRGKVREGLIRDLMPAGLSPLERRAFRKKARQSLDDAMLNAASTAVEKNPQSLFFKVAGSDVSLGELIGRAMRAMDASDPARAREWRVGAMRKIAMHVGTQAEKKIAARSVYNEMRRFTAGDDKPIPSSEVRRLIAQGEPPPQVVGPTMFDALQKANPAIADDYVTVNPRLRNYLKSEGYELPSGVMIKKGFQHTLGFQLDAMGYMGDMGMLFGSLPKVGQHAKVMLTAARYQTHANNFMANFGYEALRRGISPVGMSASLLSTLKRYQAYKGGKVTDAADLRMMRDLTAAGLDTSFLADVPSSMLKFDKGENLPAAIVKGMYSGAVRAYRFGDTLFKLDTSRHAYKRAMSVLDELGDGRNVEFELPGNRVARFEKVGGELLLDGKKVSPEKLSQVIARSAMRQANKAFFDYGSGPGALKAVRSKAGGVFSAAHPFLSWSYYSMDVPGMKKGLMSHMLDYNGGGWYRTNDPGLLRKSVASNTAIGLRRAMIVGAAQGMLDRDRDLWGSMFGFSPSGGNTVQLVQRETEPLGAKSYAPANMFGVTDALARAGLSAYTSMWGTDAVADPAEWVKASNAGKFFLGDKPLAKIKKLRQLWKLNNTGRLVNRDQVLSLFGITGGLLEGAWRDMHRADVYNQDTPWAKIAMRTLLPMVVGGTPAGMADVAAGAHDPYSELSTRRFLDAGMVPKNAEGKAYTGPEAATRHLLRKLLSVGPRPVDAMQHPDRWVKDATARLRSATEKAANRRVDKILSDKSIPREERRRRADEIMKSTQGLTRLIIETELDLLRDSTVAMRRLNLRELPKKQEGEPSEKATQDHHP